MSLRDSVIAALTDWAATDPGSDALRQAMLGFALARPDACERACVPGHFTASTAVLDAGARHVLLTLHPRLGRWVQLGGHCEPQDGDIVAAALREATEESGITGLQLTTAPVSLHVHALTCSLGVPTRHFDMQFAALAPTDAVITVSDESLDLRWWPVDALPPDADDALRSLVGRAAAQISLE
ncbi:MAG: NUDIX hydrolase [Mycobacterium sp.]|nr:NUDIX hydrolase [Mycobacterium sp.]